MAVQDHPLRSENGFSGFFWLIMQSHFAMPYVGQAAGQSFPGAR
jgi:hypothetical protein